MSCAFWSGEPSFDLCHVCNSQPEWPEGLGLHRCPVSGGLSGSRGRLFGPAKQKTHQQLCEQGQLMSDLRNCLQYFWNVTSPCNHLHSLDPLAQVPLELNAGQALGIEVLCTFQMVFTVFAVCDQKRRDCIEPGNLAIGLAHSTGVLLGVRMAFFHPCFLLFLLLKKSLLVVRLYRSCQITSFAQEFSPTFSENWIQVLNGGDELTVITVN